VSPVKGEPVKGIREESGVVLSESCTDHDFLKPGEIGFIIKVDESDVPFQVQFNGNTHWYRRDELKAVCNQAGFPVSRGRKECSHIMCVLITH